jgi:hypothetical protein
MSLVDGSKMHLNRVTVKLHSSEMLRAGTEIPAFSPAGKVPSGL